MPEHRLDLRRVTGAAVIVAAAGFTLFAQAPGSGGQQPAAAPAGGAQQAPAQGRGGRQGGPPVQDNTGADFTAKPPIKAKTPEEQAGTFLLPAGYRLELVAADPDINNPAIIEWDGNGRMYVSEFRSYMLDADATGEHEPTNRISRWEDTDGDGRYDKHTVFADHIMFARAIIPLDGNSILINETHSDDVLKLTDTDNDGVADLSEVVFSGVGVGRDGNVEHEQANFTWMLDNWIYSTYNAFRFRWTPNGYLREPTAPNGASWGLTQDDDGKPWFINAGAERGPVNFQFPIQYGSLTLDDGFEPGFDTVWPAPGIADMQGGMRRVRQPIGALNHFTATAGADLYRGDRLPEDLRGDLLFTEPVGRLIRRARVVVKDGVTQLQNATPGSEFILGTDPLFRPVNMKTGPDGTIYIADMYHGIIQEAQWTPPGSYLRAKIEQYQLDKITSYGRIWRLRFDGLPAVPATAASPAKPAVPGIEPDRTRPRMLEETPAQLVAHLSHPNGWWRDMAQRLLVLKQDRSVVPVLQRLARSSDPLVARFHALWTLEGLGALDAPLVRELLKDASPRMRVQAIRASETLYKAGDKSFAADYTAAAADPDVTVAMQALLTLNVLKVPDAAAVIQKTMASNPLRGVQEVGKYLLTPAPVMTTINRTLSDEQRALVQQGETIYKELCFECHGSDGRGAPMAGAPAGTTMAPPLAGSPRVQGHRDYVFKAVLHGLTGPVGGRTYSQVMIPLGTQSDEWVAAVGSYVRTSFGNAATAIAPEDVARVRAETANHKGMWTQAEIEAALPVLLRAQPSWKLTASDNAENASRALTLEGWSSGAPQRAGMWIQIELPEPVTVAEVEFSAAAGGRLGRTTAGRGRGGVQEGPPPIGYAREYTVETSMHGKTWMAAGSGKGTPIITASLTPARAKFVRITQTATSGDAPPWVVQGLRLYAAP
jgi:mono/diheme cytochrome c family protein/glucose/arabinose dehydrogenase